MIRRKNERSGRMDDNSFIRSSCDGGGRKEKKKNRRKGAENIGNASIDSFTQIAVKRTGERREV